MKGIFLFFFIAILIGFANLRFFSFKKTETPFQKPFLRKNILTPTQIPISPLTLEKIFFGDKTYLASLDQNNLITIISTGDIIPARMVNFQSEKNDDYAWAFKNVANALSNADLTVANLESPLMTDCKATTEGMTFCGSEKNIQGLILSGIDLVTLANNHIDNYGQEGIDETIKLLDANNIKHTGLGEITYATVRNIRFAFLGWNFLVPLHENEVTSQVAEAKKNSDIVVIFPHWGEEYQEVPSDFEISMNKILLNAGADIILGNHPHIIQPILIGNNTLTFFAHGNFIFDQEWSEETKKGFVAKTYIYNRKIIDVEIIPIYIKNFGQPEIVTGESKTKMLNDLYKLSLKHKSRAK